MPELNLSTETLPLVRASLAQMSFGAVERPDLTTTEVMVAGPAGAPDVRVLVTRPATRAAAPASGLLWLHGGGYVLGRPEMNEPFIASVAAELGTVVVAPDYRLAPETTAPGAVEDSYAVLAWMHAEAASLGLDPDRIAVAGESAGGGLAAALSVLARDRAELGICLSLLVYPMLDDRTSLDDDPNPTTGEYVWNRGSNRFGWTSLLGHAPGGAGVSPYASPARVEDPAGLPPTFIAVGALDLFLDEDVAYAGRLSRAGVSTELHVYPGAFHGFFGFEGPEVGTAIRQDVARALRRALAP
jgi:acetyl esterase/lipase